MKTLVQKDTYTLMFRAALFTINRHDKTQVHINRDEWIKRLL